MQTPSQPSPSAHNGPTIPPNTNTKATQKTQHHTKGGSGGGSGDTSGGGGSSNGGPTAPPPSSHKTPSKAHVAAFEIASNPAIRELAIAQSFLRAERNQQQQQLLSLQQRGGVELKTLGGPVGGTPGHPSHMGRVDGGRSGMQDDVVDGNHTTPTRWGNGRGGGACTASTPHGHSNDTPHDPGTPNTTHGNASYGHPHGEKPPESCTAPPPAGVQPASPLSSSCTTPPQGHRITTPQGPRRRSHSMGGGTPSPWRPNRGLGEQHVLADGFFVSTSALSTRSGGAEQGGGVVRGGGGGTPTVGRANSMLNSVLEGLRKEVATAKVCFCV